MALDQSALRELLEALKLADVDDRIRTATEIAQIPSWPPLSSTPR
jgi:hypothetical protein